jgi:NAD(P)-dependent dehydrogenase (short-subunit alcohol dehydrogenase family)
VNGRVALVTGAGGGIGRAVALRFAQEGAAVAAADLDGDRAEQTAQAVIDQGGIALAQAVDVTQAGQVAHLVETVLARWGRLDYAHNNAGVAHFGPRPTFTAGYDEADWDRIIAVNLKGVWLCMKAELPVMTAQGSGAIVNTASVLGQVGSPGHAAYVASKHGVAGLTKTAALEYARHGVRVNAVCPGVIRTAMVEPLAANPRLEEAYLRSQAIRRYGAPEEVAEAVIWLCSDRASFVTGHLLAVDGGQLAQ